MRITREIADAVAKKSLEARRRDIQKQQESFEYDAHRAIVDRIPPNAFDQQLINSGFIQKSQTFRITDGSGKYEHGISTREPLPNIPNGFFVLDEKTFNRLRDNKQTITNLRNDAYRDERKISDALVQLRTRANAIKHIPELEQFFPEEVTTAIVPTFSNIRELLK